jgi:hypothetical protein
MQEGCTAEVNMLYSKRKISLTRERVESVGFACVSYPGSGKYDPEIDRCIRWERLSDQNLSDVAPAPSVVDRLIDEKNDDQGAILDKFMDGAQVRGRDGAVPGWWPVVVINWQGMAADHGFSDSREFFRLQAAGAIPLYVSCWYQLADGSWVLVAWPVFAISRL